MAAPITPRLYYRVSQRAVAAVGIVLGMGATIGLQTAFQLVCGPADGPAVAGITLVICVVVVSCCAVSLRKLVSDLRTWEPPEGADWPAGLSLATEPDESD